jgi:hypothetical protein
MQVAIAGGVKSAHYWVVIEVEYAGVEEGTSSSGGVTVKAGKRGLRTFLPSIFRLHVLEVIDWTRTAPLPSRVTGAGFSSLFARGRNETRSECKQVSCLEHTFRM